MSQDYECRLCSETCIFADSTPIECPRNQFTGEIHPVPISTQPRPVSYWPPQLAFSRKQRRKSRKVKRRRSRAHKRDQRLWRKAARCPWCKESYSLAEAQAATRLAYLQKYGTDTDKEEIQLGMSSCIRCKELTTK